jgi:ribosomal protein L37AE/L43A
MANAACKECGSEVSNKARSCPSCGAPVPKRTSVLIWAVVVILGFAVTKGILSPPTNDSPRSSQKVATIDKSEDAQQARKELIEKLINQGIFLKVEMSASLPRVWVKPVFYRLNFDTKERFINVVYAYYFDGTNMSDSVRVIDGHSGKEIGDYSLLNPGLKME